MCVVFRESFPSDTDVKLAPPTGVEDSQFQLPDFTATVGTYVTYLVFVYVLRLLAPEPINVGKIFGHVFHSGTEMSINFCTYHLFTVDRNFTEKSSSSLNL